MGVLARADGSAYYEQGNTRVVAAVYGPREAKNRGDALADRCIIKAELSNASFSAGERKDQRRHDKRSAELVLLVVQTFESAVLVKLYPQSQIDIFIQILQVDGGRKAACINAASLALIDAGVPMNDFVVACQAGYIDNTPLIDLNYIEECSNSPDLPVAILPNSHIHRQAEADDDAMSDADASGPAVATGPACDVVMVQMDGRLPLELFDTVINAAVEGALQIHALLKEEVKQYTLGLAETRGFVAA
jgi:exosome complex component RRP41